MWECQAEQSAKRDKLIPTRGPRTVSDYNNHTRKSPDLQSNLAPCVARFSGMFSTFRAGERDGRVGGHVTAAYYFSFFPGRWKSLVESLDPRRHSRYPIRVFLGVSTRVIHDGDVGSRKLDPREAGSATRRVSPGV